MTFLSIEGLRFSYGARRSPVLDGLSLAAEEGEVVAVVGPNGAGKSTLFRCLAGLLRPLAGRMTLADLDLRPMSRRERARRVSYLMQGAPPDIGLPVFEVVLLARRGVEGGRVTSADIRHVEETLDRLGLAALADRPARALSGGQQQMAALAQALAREPQLLLLDEPTSALDLRRQLEVIETVRGATRERGLATLVAIHDLALAAPFADRLALLGEGRVVADGRPEDVLRSRKLADTYEVRLDVERTARGTTLIDPSLVAAPGDRRAWLGRTTASGTA